MTIYEGVNPVTSPFCWRTNSSASAWTRHNGIDVSQGRNAKQRFVANRGIVTKVQGVGVNDRGRAVWIKVSDFTDCNVVFIYQHLKSTPLKVGSAVTLGQVVGYEGGSGMKESSYASHCHFEVLVNGVAVYPAAFANVPNNKGTYSGNNNPPSYNFNPLELQRQFPASTTKKASGYGAYAPHPGYQNLGAAPYTKKEDGGIEIMQGLKIEGVKNVEGFNSPNVNDVVISQMQQQPGTYMVYESGRNIGGINGSLIRYPANTGNIYTVWVAEALSGSTGLVNVTVAEAEKLWGWFDTKTETGSVSQEQYDAVVAQRNEANQKVLTLAGYVGQVAALGNSASQIAAGMQKTAGG